MSLIRYGGLPSHGNGPTFSHQLNLLPPPCNAPAQGLPGMLHYGNWGTFSPTSENSSRANPTVPSMMGLSWVASGRAPSLQSVTQPVVLDHGSGAFGPLLSLIGSSVTYTASPPAQPADFYMFPPSGSGLLGQIPRQAVPSPIIHNRILGLDRRMPFRMNYICCFLRSSKPSGFFTTFYFSGGDLKW